MGTLLALLIGLLVFISSLGMHITIPNITTPQPSQTSPEASASVSRNWSGYVAQNGSYTGVQGTWLVPNVSTQNSYAADATWIGVGGVASQDLIQTGVETLAGRNGQVMYRAFYETLPNASIPLNIAVNAGDTISASVTQNKKGLWDIHVTNNSNGQDAKLSIAYDSSLSSAEWIEEAPSTVRQIMPLDNFGSVQFTNAKTTQNNQLVTLAAAHAQAVAMGSPIAGTLATASTIGQDESSFTINRVNQEQQVQQQNPQSEYRRRVRGFARGFYFFFD